MTHIQFFPYHNKVIRFRLRGSDVWKKGVILDIVEYGKKKYSTHYSFIPLSSLKAWKTAYRNGNKTDLNRIEKEIDIKKVAVAEVLDLRTLEPSANQPARLELIS